MRRIYLAAAATLVFVPIGGPAEAGERQRATVLMAEDPARTAIGVAITLGNGTTEIKIAAKRHPATAEVN